MASYWWYDWLIFHSKWKGRGRECVISSYFRFGFFFLVFLFFVFLFVCLIFVFPVLSCFINFIFNIVVISYSMYFVVIESKKKTLLKKIKKISQNLPSFSHFTKFGQVTVILMNLGKACLFFYFLHCFSHFEDIHIIEKCSFIKTLIQKCKYIQSKVYC